jgi:hypothetical protein
MPYYKKKTEDSTPKGVKAYCQVCNKVMVIPKDASFCGECGTELEEVNKVHECGNKIPSWLKYCQFCGKVNNQDLIDRKIKEEIKI